MPRLSHKGILQYIKAHSLEPQMELYAVWLSNQPTPQAISALAERSPDRWVQAATMLQSIAGYSAKVQVEGSIVHRVEALSDSELYARIIELSGDDILQLDMQSNDALTDEPEKTPDLARLEA